MASKRRVAIVGSGFGGLGAAIRLQAAGFDCVLFEARDKPGGRAYVYEQDGFVFDAGPTVITAPHCLEELVELAGKRPRDYFELLPVTPFYRLLWSDGARFDYVGDSARLLEQIRSFNPADVDGYRRFARYAEAVFAKGYTELAATPFLRFADMLRVAPELARLRADRSVYATVARFIQDEHVRQAFSFHSLLVGGNPFDTSAIYTLIHHLERKWGVFFPRGGTGSVVRGLVRLFEELGGELRLDTPVLHIEVERAGARTRHAVSTARGQEAFDCVVSNADLHHTYARLYAREPAAQRTRKRLERMDWSMSLFVLYFGTDRTWDNLAHHTVLFGPRYRELLAEIFSGSTLPDDFSLYLHCPTVTDVSLAPPGCAAFYVLSPVPHLGHAAIDWQREGERYADRILAYLERELPDLRRHVVTRRHITPETFRDELAAYHGSAFSLAPKLAQSAWFRPHNRDPNIPGLYIVGAGTHPGAGMPGVLNSAKATASLVIADLAEHERGSLLAEREAPAL
jgi:phytoene desaturase